MSSKTTCHNFECAKYPTCTFNIYDEWSCPADKDGTNHYMSAKQANYRRYVKNGGTLSPLEYQEG
jgi:hypothetical protein